MARPRSFDVDTVLSGAMHCFRRNGYERVSIKQLEQATGLTSGSLYNSYGSKEGLFRAALDHYLETVVGTRMRDFAGPTATLADLESLFLSIFEMPQADGFGCLVTNSAVEFGPNAPTFAADKVAQGLELAGNGIRSVVVRALGGTEGARAATELTMLYHGTLVLSRAGVLGPSHREAIQAAFATLRQRAIERQKSIKGEDHADHA